MGRCELIACEEHIPVSEIQPIVCGEFLGKRIERSTDEHAVAFEQFFELWCHRYLGYRVGQDKLFKGIELFKKGGIYRGKTVIIAICECVLDEKRDVDGVTAFFAGILGKYLVERNFECFFGYLASATG